MSIRIVDYPPWFRALLDGGSSISRLRDYKAQREDETAPHKLLHREHSIGVLIKLNGAYRLLVWQPPSPYTSMPTTSASSYFAEIRRDDELLSVANFKNLSDDFHRLVASDGDNSVTRAVRARHVHHGEGEHLMKTTDALHNLSKITESQNEMCHESMMVKHCVLSLRFDNNLRTFRN